MRFEWLAQWFTWLPNNPLLGILLTFVVFYLANKLYLSCRNWPGLHPVLISMLVIIVCLKMMGIEYVDYMAGGQLIHFVLGPATVALAWPLYQNHNTIKKLLLPIVLSVASGILVGATSAIYLAQWLDASLLTQLSLAPKSVTTPVAIVVAEEIGGLPSLTAGFVIITGVVGAMFGGLIFSWLGIEDQRVKGIAMGVSAHGVGTAKAWQINHTMGAYSGLAMALAAVMISFVLPPWLHILGFL